MLLLLLLLPLPPPLSICPGGARRTVYGGEEQAQAIVAAAPVDAVAEGVVLQERQEGGLGQGGEGAEQRGEPARDKQKRHGGMGTRIWASGKTSYSEF